MGNLCGGGDGGEKAEARKKDAEVRREMQMAREREGAISKLLLLGAGESGKSTLFKQMNLIYGTNKEKGLSQQEAQEYIPIVYTNVIGSMKTLCEQSIELGKRIDGLEISAANQASRQFVEELKETATIDVAVAAHLKALWDDQGVQNTYDQRNQFHLTDSTAYFMNKISEIGSPDYLPNAQDFLRGRVRTTGIVESEYEIDGNRFKIFDVGGQRNERKKWIHCFSDVTAVLFVAALSAYDQVLYEDEDCNRMDEALNLFDEICNSRWFKKTSMILLLNKKDLFEEKILRIPLTVCFPDYAGANEYNEASQFIRGEFESRNKDSGRQIYTHITLATDSDMMRGVFHAVKDTVIRMSLQAGGLLAY